VDIFFEVRGWYNLVMGAKLRFILVVYCNSFPSTINGMIHNLPHV
jgi:hypothetical protein